MSSGDDGANHLQGPYDVWKRLGRDRPGEFDGAHQPSEWAAASWQRVLQLMQMELALTESRMSKVAIVVEENEVDGEVLSTFSSLAELCDATGLDLVEDLAIHSLNTDPAPGETFEASATRWGEILADGFAGRRLLARSRCDISAFSSPEQLKEVLSGIAFNHIQEAVKGPKISGVSATKIIQIQLLAALPWVVHAARLTGQDLKLMAPAEAMCLAPPWLRKGIDEETTMLLVSVLLRVSSIDASASVQMLPTIPPTTIVVLGNTGAGKSTLLNAFLGETELLPTNAMRACTACIIEMEYNPLQHEGALYTARVEFSSAEEWEIEVKEAFLLIEAAQGQTEREEGASLTIPEGESPALEAWHKLCAAYGKDVTWTSASALLAPPSAEHSARCRIHSSLGTELNVEASTAAQLLELYSMCVDSSNDALEGSLWPIVKRVVLRGPWAVLSLGVRLVDAPGLADDNSARDMAVKKVLQKANAIWLVSNIRRAVNDKTVKDMMPPNFKQALVEKGVLGSLVFVATQTDIIVRSEVAENLNLAPDVKVLDAALHRNGYFRNKITADFKRGINLESDKGEGIAAGQQPMISHQMLIELHAASLHAKVNAFSMVQSVPGITQEQRDLICRGLLSGNITDEAFIKSQAATPRPNGFDFELAAFAISAVDFQKLSGLRTADGPPSVYHSLADTQMPALRDFVRATALVQRFSPFKAGAELVRCLQEAKEAAAREEEEAMSTSTQQDHNLSSHSCAQPDVLASRAYMGKCRYCSDQVLSGSFDSFTCVDGSKVHKSCYARARLVMKHGSWVRVDGPRKSGACSNSADLVGQVVKVFSSVENDFKVETRFSPRYIQGWYLIPVDAAGEPVLRLQRQPPQQPMPPTMPVPLQPQILQQQQHLLHASLHSQSQKEATLENALEQRNPLARVENILTEVEISRKARELAPANYNSLEASEQVVKSIQETARPPEAPMPDTSARSAAAPPRVPATSQAAVGSRVFLQGLKHAMQFNGKYGIVVATVQKHDEERLSVSLEQDGSLISVKRSNAEVVAANVSEAARGAVEKQKSRAEALEPPKDLPSSTTAEQTAASVACPSDSKGSRASNCVIDLTDSPPGTPRSTGGVNRAQKGRRSGRVVKKRRGVGGGGADAAVIISLCSSDEES